MLDDNRPAATDAVKHVASADAYGQKFVLAEGDAKRTAQLAAEINDHLAEIAQIFAATSGTPCDGAALRFVPRASADSAVITYVEILRLPQGNACLITLADGSQVFEFPCSNTPL